MNRKCFYQGRLGVPGPLDARRLGPWPPRRSRSCRSHALAGPGRSLSLATPRGPGARPPAPLAGKPARGSKPRQAARNPAEIATNGSSGEYCGCARRALHEARFTRGFSFAYGSETDCARGDALGVHAARSGEMETVSVGLLGRLDVRRGRRDAARGSCHVVLRGVNADVAATLPRAAAFDPATDISHRERQFSGRSRSVGLSTAACPFTAGRAAVFGAPQQRRYYSLPQTSMTQPYDLVVSFVHGNAVGLILEPHGIRDYADADEVPKSWQVRIGPLAPEAAVGAPFPSEDFKKVVADLVLYCRDHGIEYPGSDGGEVVE